MTSSQQKPMFMTLLIASAAVVVYLFCVEPTRQSLEKARRDGTALEDQRAAMFRDLKGVAQVKGRLESIEAGRRPYLDALLTPLLESYAMRAKSFLDPLAADACLQIKDYEELEPRALPLVSLQAFSLKVQNTPDEQTATMVFEWPVKGVNTAALTAQKGGVKK